MRPYVHKRGGAEPKMPRAKPHQLAVTIGVGYLRLFGGAHTNCTPVAATATVADLTAPTPPPLRAHVLAEPGLLPRVRLRLHRPWP